MKSFDLKKKLRQYFYHLPGRFQRLVIRKKKFQSLIFTFPERPETRRPHIKKKLIYNVNTLKKSFDNSNFFLKNPKKNFYCVFFLFFFLVELLKQCFFFLIYPKTNFLSSNLPSFYSLKNFTVNFKNLRTLLSKMNYF